MNDQFTLGLDLDGVAAHYTAGMAQVVEEDRGLEPGSLPEPTDWGFSNWNFESGDFMKYHTELVVNRNGFRTLPVMEGCSEALWRLSDAGVWIRVTTHRLLIKGQHALIGADTIAWLEENSIPYRDLCFLEAKADQQSDLSVDDGPHNIEALQDAGQNTVVFDQPYNQHCTGPRVKDWVELEAFVLEAQERWADDKRFTLGG